MSVAQGPIQYMSFMLIKGIGVLRLMNDHIIDFFQINIKWLRYFWGFIYSRNEFDIGELLIYFCVGK